MIISPNTVKLMHGNEAVVEGAIMAGIRFFAGYPITPATEILEEFSRRLPEVGGICVQMEDEIASLAAVLGASLGGVKAITASSGPGLSLMVENICMAIMEEIPCVIVDVQRIGPATGSIATTQGDVMFAKWGTPAGNEIIALAPSSVAECLELTIKAVNLSEKFRVPVFLLSDAYLGHLREKVNIKDFEKIEIINRPKPTVPPERYLSYDTNSTGIPAMADLGFKYRSRFVSSVHDKSGKYDPPIEDRGFLLHRLHDKILAHQDEILMTEKIMLDNAQIAVFAYGICARSAQVAVIEARKQGIKVGLFRPISIWPFPDEAVGQLAEQVKRIIVVEMNLGQLVREVERASRGKTEITFLGDDIGELISPEKILEEIRR
jgi:2-oxoglutarate ferredoxin oxidoreductase subunit alpha